MPKVRQQDSHILYLDYRQPRKGRKYIFLKRAALFNTAGAHLGLSLKHLTVSNLQWWAGSTLSQTTTYWQTAFSEAACDHLPVQTSNSDLKHLSLKWSSPTQSNQRNRSSPWSRLLNWYQHVHCSPLPQQVIQNPSGVAILIICQLENIPGR